MTKSELSKSHFANTLIRSLRILSVALLMITVIGCDTDRPLSDPQTAEIDPKLLGTWTALEPVTSRKVFLFIGRHSVKDDPNGIIEISLVEYDQKKQKIGAPQVIFGSITTIGQHRLLNIFYNGDKPATLDDGYLAWAHSNKRSCVILSYNTDGASLTASRLGGKKYGQLLESQTLTQNTNSRGVSAESLIAYIQKFGANGIVEPFGLFDDTVVRPLVFKKSS